MSLGVYSDYIGEVISGDTVSLRAYLTIYEQPVTADQIQSVTFTVQSPATTLNVNDTTYTLPVSEIGFVDIEGISDSGICYMTTNLGIQTLNYTGISGNAITGVTGGTSGAIISPNAEANFVFSTTEEGLVQDDGGGYLLWTNTEAIGPYTATCQFYLVTGEKRSVFVSFSVIDPFNPPDPTPIDQITEQVWLRLSDIFDSTEGGPHLRDATMANFDQNKIAQFIPEALFDINVQMPPTNFDIAYFTMPVGQEGYNPNMPLLIKGTLVLTIRHLMRSYTEIYTPTGQGQLVWPDRTRYQQAWGQIYEIEYQDYIAAVRLLKRTTLQLGRSALLTLSKAGRLYPYSNYSARGVSRSYY